MALAQVMHVNCGIPQNMNIVTKVNSPIKATTLGYSGVVYSLSLTTINAEDSPSNC